MAVFSDNSSVRSVLTSLQNPRIKELVRLRDRRPRDRSGVFLIEGYRAITRALEQGVHIADLYVCPALFQGTNEGDLISRCATSGSTVHETSDPVFRKIAYRDRPEGLLAVAAQVHKGLDDAVLGAVPFLLVAEAIEKPGNLGTMLRSADAVGVDALILCDPCTDPFNPNVVRASTGALFSVPLIEADSTDALAWLKARGIRILAATPHATDLYTDVDMRQPLAIAVGTEQYGLSQTWMNEADLCVRIPMFGMADSLNVANATTLLLYEVVRQRGQAGNDA